MQFAAGDDYLAPAHSSFLASASALNISIIYPSQYLAVPFFFFVRVSSVHIKMPVWEEHAYTRKDEHGNVVSLADYEATHASRIFTYADFKLYAICGVGFLLDSYDLFIVNLASPIWGYEFFTKGDLGTTKTVPAPSIPFLVKGAVNAAANIGNVVGQIMFGFLGDAFGRKFVYGKELIIAIIGIIMIISLPVNGTAGLKTGIEKMWWLFGFRFLLGIGIGGDYPMSAAIVAERSTLSNRGRMLGWIFSNQGWVGLSFFSQNTRQTNLLISLPRVPCLLLSSLAFSSLFSVIL